MLKATMQCFSCLVLAVSANWARADDSSSAMQELTIIAIGIGAETAIVSSYPKEAGALFLLTSPFFDKFGEGGSLEWPYYLLGVAAVAGYGAWLISKKDADKSDIARPNAIGLTSIIVPAWVYGRTQDDKSQGHFTIQDDPFTSTPLLMYTVRF